MYFLDGWVLGLPNRRNTCQSTGQQVPTTLGDGFGVFFTWSSKFLAYATIPGFAIPFGDVIGLGSFQSLLQWLDVNLVHALEIQARPTGHEVKRPPCDITTEFLRIVDLVGPGKLTDFREKRYIVIRS
jgi:hypothetical protein